MPTYEYECTKCRVQFERFQSMTEAPLKRCPECRCKVRRLIGTGAGIIFKGSGFYQTDYRSNDYHEAAKKDKTAGESASTESKKTDSEAKKPDKPKVSKAGSALKN